jgi:DNA repair exonuclease SbcCD ATPase subunit
MIIFEKIRWKNFLSTGNVFTEINLSSTKTNLIVGANGAGKSTILDALTFSLFGKPFRKISKGMLVNSINEKDTVVEIEFSKGPNKFKIVRGIKPNKLEIYQNGEMLDQSSNVNDYQKQLEHNILKMNYKSFTQIVVLGSSTFVPFMRLPTTQRREIIEDILDIQIFSMMNQVLKDKVRTSNDELKQVDYETHLAEEKINMQKDFISAMGQKNLDTIVSKQEKIEVLMQEEEEIISKNKIAIVELDNLSDAKTKLRTLNTLKGKIEQKFNTHKKQHEFFVKNTTCPTCSQSLTKELKESKITTIMESIKELQTGFKEMETSIALAEDREREHSSISKAIAEHNTTSLRIQKQIKEVYDEIETLQNEKNNTIQEEEKLIKLETDYLNLKKLVATMKEERNTLLAATILLKDNGIKTRVIKRYLPVMNKLINQHLQNLEFYVNFNLDENFEETIKSRYRDTFTYESFSEGEKARIDIALLLTWRSIAKLKNSVDTNILILDEIFDGSLDQNGTGELGWILRNFDDNTNIFVISHKETLEGKFERTLLVEKHQNYSVVKESVNEVD